MKTKSVLITVVFVFGLMQGRALAQEAKNPAENLSQQIQVRGEEKITTPSSRVAEETVNAAQESSPHNWVAKDEVEAAERTNNQAQPILERQGCCNEGGDKELFANWAKQALERLQRTRDNPVSSKAQTSDVPEANSVSERGQNSIACTAESVKALAETKDQIQSASHGQPCCNQQGNPLSLGSLTKQQAGQIERTPDNPNNASVLKNGPSGVTEAQGEVSNKGDAESANPSTSNRQQMAELSKGPSMSAARPTPLC